MTPREFYRERDAAVQRWRDEWERDLTRAWWTANLTAAASAGKLPSLQSVINKTRAVVNTRATVAAQQANLAMLSEHLKVAIRPMSNEARQALQRMRVTDGR